MQSCNIMGFIHFSISTFNSISPEWLRHKLTMGVNSALEGRLGCGAETSGDRHDNLCHCRIVFLVGIWVWGGVCLGCFWTIDQSIFSDCCDNMKLSLASLSWQQIAIHTLQLRWSLNLDLLAEVFLSSFHLIWVDIHLYPYSGCKWSLPELDCALNLFSCGRIIWSVIHLIGVSWSPSKPFYQPPPESPHWWHVSPISSCSFELQLLELDFGLPERALLVLQSLIMKIPTAASPLNIWEVHEHAVTRDDCALFSILLLNCFQAELKAKSQLNG